MIQIFAWVSAITCILGCLLTVSAAATSGKMAFTDFLSIVVTALHTTVAIHVINS